jgi:RPA family protein
MDDMNIGENASNVKFSEVKDVKKRIVAKKVRISDIVKGKFFAGDMELMRPNTIITPLGQSVSRVNILASITDKFVNEDASYGSITLDDGTAAIRVKVFRDDMDLIKNVDRGSTVAAIGKLKEYNGEIYVTGEIVKPIEDKNYESMRKLEILHETMDQKKIVDEIKGLAEQVPEEELAGYVKNNFGVDQDALKVVLENARKENEKKIDYKPKMLELIGSIDDGNGVEIRKILEMSDLPENIIENTINDLLGDGVLFEPRPGVLKRI